MEDMELFSIDTNNVWYESDSGALGIRNITPSLCMKLYLLFMIDVLSAQ